MQKIMYSTEILVLTFLSSMIYVITSSEDGSKMGEKISLSVPKLSEEENESNHMPKHLQCDACLAVVYQVHSTFTRAKGKKPSISESDILEILENLCNSGFDDYGVKQVDGINRLSGPGLNTEHVMGMTQMGGRWPHRLQEMCHYYIGEAGEFDIYDAFNEGKDQLTKFLCHGKGIFGHCRRLLSPTKTEL